MRQTPLTASLRADPLPPPFSLSISLLGLLGVDPPAPGSRPGWSKPILQVYPPLRDIRSVSAHVAAAVAAHAHATGVASVAPPDDMVAFCQRTQWNPGDDQSKL